MENNNKWMERWADVTQLATMKGYDTRTECGVV